jgi:hypothetical protein
LWLFFVPVSLLVAEESEAAESDAAADFFLDFLVAVLEVALSSAVPASFFDLLVFFFVVVVSLL